MQMHVWTLTLLGVLVSCVFLFSLWYHVWHRTPVALCTPHRCPMKVGVVLGSGGHTSEMLRAIRVLPPSFWHDNRPFYVVSATDPHSSEIAQQQEQTMFQRRTLVYTIPRAREVGQSYATSVFSTLRAAVASLRVIVAERPDVLLTNGPGVCIPVIAAAVCVAACLPWWYRRPAIVYMESFTCVTHLSLTGRLLAPFIADVFTVHWHSLEAVVRRCRRRGTLVYVGCEDSGEADDAAADVDADADASPPTRDAYALVTVGSTKFTALVEAVVQPQLCAALREHFGLKKLYVQYGTAAFSMPAGATALPTEEGAPQQWACGGLCVEVFPYRPHLDALIRTAMLVVTHAGAGTILEGLQARRPLVVVPNRQLMSDHQLELADGLAAGRFLFSLQVAELAEKLPMLDVSALRPHQGMNAEQLKKCLQLVLTGHAESTEKSKMD